MKRIILCAIPLLAAGAMLPTLGGCAERVGVYGSVNPAGYDYYYYPESQVYFSPSANVYYWHEKDHDRWQNGRALPHQYHVDDHSRVALHLNTDRPYTMHNQVQADHPWHADAR